MKNTHTSLGELDLWEIRMQKEVQKLSQEMRILMSERRNTISHKS